MIIIMLIMAKQQWALADGVVFANYNWQDDSN